MNLNKKTIVISFMSFSLALGVGTALSNNPTLPHIVDAEDISYTLLINKDSNKSIDDIDYVCGFDSKTSNGNIINFEAAWVEYTDDEAGILEDYGYIKNITPINGLKSISIELGDISEGVESNRITNTLNIYWGWIKDIDLSNTLIDYTKEINTVSDSNITFDFNGDEPSYFAIFSETDCVEIKNITLNYSCVESDIPTTYGYDFVLDGDDSYLISNYILDSNVDLVIPSEYKGKPITGIDYEVFKEHDEIKTVSFPNTITHIDQNAFLNCHSLETVYIPSSLQYIGGYGHDEYGNAFGCCPKLSNFVIDEDNQYFDFVDGCLLKYNAKISDYAPLQTMLVCATAGCTVPSQVQVIDSYAFYGPQYVDVVINYGCKELLPYSFGDLKNISRIFIPSSMVSIVSNAFIYSVSKNVRFFTDATEAAVVSKNYWGCADKIRDHITFEYNENFEPIINK